MQQSATLGVPLEFEFEFQGRKTWKITNPITFDIEGMFAVWVYSQAIDRIERLRALGQASPGQGMTEEQYQRAFDRLTDNAAALKFEWGSEIVSKAAVESWAGIKHLLYLRLKKQHQEATPALVDAIFADPIASARLRALFNPQPAAVADNGTSSVPATAADPVPVAS